MIINHTSLPSICVCGRIHVMSFQYLNNINIIYLNGCMLWLVTASHQEVRPSDRMTLAPPDRKSRHTLSSTVRKDENRVLRRDMAHGRQSYAC